MLYSMSILKQNTKLALKTVKIRTNYESWDNIINWQALTYSTGRKINFLQYATRVYTHATCILEGIRGICAVTNEATSLGGDQVAEVLRGYVVKEASHARARAQCRVTF